MIDNLIQQATCSIRCGDEQGTGSLIAPQRVLTAAHCVRGATPESKVELTFATNSGSLTVAATILNISDELDACILCIVDELQILPLPLATSKPRAGAGWKSFGYPTGKAAIGHRLSGIISHTLSKPNAKLDMDLSVDQHSRLTSYHGISGAAVVSGSRTIGLIRSKLNGTLGAISVHALSAFLKSNGIQPSEKTDAGSPPELPKISLASRTRFQRDWEDRVLKSPGEYIFIEGVHGIGKTTFCQHYSPISQQICILGAYCFRATDQQSSVMSLAQPEMFVDWLSTKIAYFMLKEPSRIEKLSYSEQMAATAELLTTFSNHCMSLKKRGIIFIDGLNEINDMGQPVLHKFLGLLPARLPADINIILTGPNYSVLTPSLSNFIKAVNVFNLPRLDIAACEAYCRRELVDPPRAARFIHLLCDKAQGHPLYLRYLIEYAQQNIEDQLLPDFPELRGPIEDYYERLWSGILGDDQAVFLLSIIARLRTGIDPKQLLLALDNAEQAVFLTTFRRIQHLLLTPDFTVIYHPSFEAFLLLKTQVHAQIVHNRLATFCESEAALPYCTLNLVYHMLQSEATMRRKAIVICDQNWVDSCVRLGIEPDQLLRDVGDTLLEATAQGDALAVIRLLLLSNRLTFRYNILLAQSAALMGEALIALNRPQEALRHAIRFESLIVDPTDALAIAFSLTKNGHENEAVEILDLVRKMCVESYDKPMTVETFVDITITHLRSVMLQIFAGGKERLTEVNYILHHACTSLKRTLQKDDPQQYQQCLTRILGRFPGHLLAFYDIYASVNDPVRGGNPIKEITPSLLIAILVDYNDAVNAFGLNKGRNMLSVILTDLEQMLSAGKSIENMEPIAVADSLLEIGANANTIQLIAEKQLLTNPKPDIHLRGDNGVDFPSAEACAYGMWWTVFAFLDQEAECPLIRSFSNEGWLDSLADIVTAVFFCKGRAYRAKVDKNDAHLSKVRDTLTKNLLPALSVRLSDRIHWSNSYALPEAILPFIYHHLSELLANVFPDNITDLISAVKQSGSNQLGTYTEGYRECLRVISENLKSANLASSAGFFEVITLWKHHVTTGVENRHELVPELLTLIAMFARAGANEEAARLFNQMLSVSMGPSWYKEDQMGLMTSVISKMSMDESAKSTLPVIAGYLERASGELTFQRFVRQEKHILLGMLFAGDLFKEGFQYYRQQTCGTVNELVAEWTAKPVDAPNVHAGYRYPGNALEEQPAILQIVENAKSTPWRFRWALLEVFQLGDDRYTGEFADAFAGIVNENEGTPSIVRELAARMETTLLCDSPIEQRAKFATAFAKKLSPTLRANFPFGVQEPPESSDEPAPFAEVDSAPNTPAQQPTASQKRAADSSFFLPGIIGKATSMATADSQFNGAMAELNKGNEKAAQEGLVAGLETLQDGGWSVWGNTSKSKMEAEDTLSQLSKSAAELIRHYGRLLQNEGYNPPSMQAEHLIGRLGAKLNNVEKRLLFDVVTEHIALMVGDASQEKERFTFLNTNVEDGDRNRAWFYMICWLIDHPVRIRSESAATAILWLVESELALIPLAIEHAFIAAEGYASDLLCAILDEKSSRSPLAIWQGIEQSDGFEESLKCDHFLRLVILRKIAKRAQKAGSPSADIALKKIDSNFRPGRIVLNPADVDITYWMEAVEPEIETLKRAGVITQETVAAMFNTLKQLYAPLSVKDAYQLEQDVCRSFKSSMMRSFSRWECRVRCALNRALLPYVSLADVEPAESILRPYNPSFPCKGLNPRFVSHAAEICRAIEKGGSYKAAVEDGDYFFLHYNEYAIVGEDRTACHLTITAVVVSSLLLKRGFFLPKIEAHFLSNAFPDTVHSAREYETCYSLIPIQSFFGTFTPSIPSPTFKSLIGSNDSDFKRFNWRGGRSDAADSLGCPINEGCVLAVKKGAVKLPEGKKLAWIISLNGEAGLMVDAGNNRLY
jgi:hypothetical protein